MGMHQMLGPISSSGADYEITRSLRFNSADTAYLNRTPSSAGNRRTFTWAGWVKNTTDGTFRALIEGYAGSEAASVRTSFQLNNANKLHILFDNTSSGDLLTTAVFRDPSAWYHIVLAVDTTQGTNTDRVKIYVNGVRETSFSSYSTITQNLELHINSATEHAIGRYEAGDSNYFPGYLTEINFVDGQALAPTDFGETNDDGL